MNLSQYALGNTRSHAMQKVRKWHLCWAYSSATCSSDDCHCTTAKKNWIGTPFFRFVEEVLGPPKQMCMCKDAKLMHRKTSTPCRVHACMSINHYEKYRTTQWRNFKNTKRRKIQKWKTYRDVGCCESRMAERIHSWTERWLELCFFWGWPEHNCWM